MADSIYNLETRLHQLATTLPLLSGYYTEYVGYTGVPFSISFKIDREVSHKYLELAGTAYYSGALASGASSGNFILTQDGDFFIMENSDFLITQQ